MAGREEWRECVKKGETSATHSIEYVHVEFPLLAIDGSEGKRLEEVRGGKASEAAMKNGMRRLSRLRRRENRLTQSR